MKKIYKEPNKSETETTVNVLYSEEKIKIYTNKVKLQKQLNKVLGEPSKEYKIKKSILLYKFLFFFIHSNNSSSEIILLVNSLIFSLASFFQFSNSILTCPLLDLLTCINLL